MVRVSFVCSVFTLAESFAAVCPVDGYNVVRLSDALLAGDNHLSLSGPDTSEAFFDYPEVRENTPRLWGGLFLGAETGDPLLNYYTSSQPMPNRDHRSLVEAGWNLKCMPLSLVVRYRYIDTYSDRFDDIWDRYATVNGSAMAFYKDGVGYEAFAAAVYKRGVTEAKVAINPYTRWHATPFFFSPLLEKGTSAEANIHKEIGRLEITTVLRARKSDWYYNHLESHRFLDFTAKPQYRYHLTDKVSCFLAPSFISEEKPNARVVAGLDYKDSVYSYGIAGGTLSNKKLAGNIYATSSFAYGVTCSLSVAHDYRSRERDYTFLEMDTLVEYHTRGFGRLTAFSNVRWRNSRWLPCEVNAWISHDAMPLTERVEFHNDRVIIRQHASGEAATSFAGLQGEASHTVAACKFDIRSAIITPVGERTTTQFIIGKFAEVSAAYATPNEHPIAIAMKLVYNDQPRLRYETITANGVAKDTLFTAPVNVSLYLDCTVPFIFYPVRRILSETSFVVNGGPVRLYGPYRSAFHPRGNRFGPEIYAGFTGAIK